MSTLSDIIFESVDSLISKKIESTSIDQTITATVTKLQDVSIAEYKVYYEGATFSAYGMDLVTTYAVGDSVYVLVPEGNFSATKIILGSADFSANTTYADQQALMNQWRTRGSNWLSGAMYWRDADGNFDTSAVEGGIVATTYGDESGIGPDISYDDSGDEAWPASNPCWRNYIYNRHGFPTSSELTLTEDRIRRSYNISPDAAGETLTTALESVDTELQLYGSQMDYLRISANFETNFLSAHTSGEYGIKVECYVDNPNWVEGSTTENQYKLQTYTLTFSDFNGSPYAFAVPAYQEAVFAVSRNTIRGLARVYLFQNDAWKTDLGPETGTTGSDGVWTASADGMEVNYSDPIVSSNNIFATDVAIYWCEPIELSSNMFWMDMKTNSGTSVYTGDGSQSSYSKVTLQPRLMYGYDDVTSEETCKFIWFRRKYNVTSDMAADFDVDEYGNTWAGYLPEGEQGWCPIEEMIKSPEDSLLGQSAAYKLGTMVDSTFTEGTTGAYADTLQVPISEVPWKWDYLCVCYYNPDGGSIDDIYRTSTNDALIWMTQTVTNTSSIHNFELPDAYIPDGTSEVYLRVRNNTAPWDLAIPYDADDPSLPHLERDWYCRWWIEAGGSYYALEDADNDRFIKGRRRITSYINNEVLKLKAQVYGINPEEDTSGTDEERVKRIAQINSDGSKVWTTSEAAGDEEGDEYEIANLEITIAPADSATLLVEFTGTTSHNYNSSGLRTSTMVADIYTITPTITITDNSVMDFSIEWLDPNKEPIKERDEEMTSLGSGYEVDREDTMIAGMWTTYSSSSDTQCILYYRVEEAYDIDSAAAAGNTFYLKVTYLDGTYDEVPCTITYSMAGYNGTQGSDWTANIWPCNPSQTGDIATVAWTTPILSHPVPLVVKGDYKGVTAGTAMAQGGLDDFQLYLRPFIKRNGTLIENLTESTKYSYKIFWDSRLSAVNGTGTARDAASYGNFIKFKHVSDRDATDYGADGSYTDGNFTLVGGTAYSAGTTLPANVADSQAFTCSEDLEAGADATTKTYGALQVLWNGRSSIEDSLFDNREVTFEDVGYSFVVKARIEIYYDGTGVASLTSFYPVDIIFTGDSNTDISIADVNPEKMVITWPTEVIYTSSGTAPVTSSSPLTFYYGDNAVNGSDANIYTSKVENLTPEIQDIEDCYSRYNIVGAWSALDTYKYEDGVIDVVYYDQNYFCVRTANTTVTGTVPDIYLTNDETHPWKNISDLTNWYLSPREYYFFENYDNGAIATNIIENTGKWPAGSYNNPDFSSWGDSDLPESETEASSWRHCTYVRPIVYYLNQYGNESINGWDGKSIDINEEDGTIFAPTIGAGWKHPFTNTFSGVIMGIDSSQLKENYTADYGGFSQDDINMNPYMTGLFGYQDGNCSFGIMENGTAFFGRADTGGRITIDGYNAQIYGGTTMGGQTGLLADMRNRMRLSFIDFGGSAATMDLETWTEDEQYYTQVSDYQAWLTIYEVYYYYVTGEFLPTLQQPDANSSGTAYTPTRYTVKSTTSDNDIEITIYVDEILDWDRYATEIQYRYEVDAIINDFILLMNEYPQSGCTIGPIVNGEPGIAMEGFAVDGYTDPITGRIVSDATEEDLENGTVINSDFANFFAPGIGCLSGAGTQIPADKLMGVDYVAAQFGGFITGSSYSTPAIEIGSYEDWLYDDEGNRRVETREYWLQARYGDDYDSTKTYYHSGNDLIRSFTSAQIQDFSTAAADLEMPGYRKFLVTYDGTLYAMNAFIKGNIVGSNIIGSQFFNADGSYVVFENGDLGIGQSDEEWTETRVNSGYSELWSGDVPTTRVVDPFEYFGGDDESKKNFLNYDKDGNENRFSFFVANNGSVVCEKLYIGGGAINIGTFHVLGKEETDGTTEGDVVSFGTMYLVGSHDGMPDIGDTAVEGWGDFNLRGRLVNLGPVFLGGQTEKEQPGSRWTSASSSAEYPNSFNSPIAIVPGSFGNRTYTNEPNLPVEIGIWPLYFHVEEYPTVKENNDNLNWVCFSSATNDSTSYTNGFMPAFSARSDTDFTSKGDGSSPLANRVFWRVDQLGMWSDGIMFSSRALGRDVDDDTSLSFKYDGLGYMGWWSMSDVSDESTYNSQSLAIQNYAYKARNFVVETPRGYRFGSRGSTIGCRSGTTEYSGSDLDSFVIMETAENYKFGGTNPRSTATIALSSSAAITGSESGGGSPTDMIAATAGTVFLAGQRKLMSASELAAYCGTKAGGDSRSGYDYVMDAFISINGLMGSSDLSSNWSTIVDEYGRDITHVPAYNPGQIWIKGKGVVLDGSDAGFDTGSYYSIANPSRSLSTIRLNRDPQGNRDESNASGASESVLSIGMNPKSSIYMRAADIEIASQTFSDISEDYGSGNIHIKTNRSEVPDTSTYSIGNEIFLDGGNRENITTGYTGLPGAHSGRGAVRVSGRDEASLAAGLTGLQCHTTPPYSKNGLTISSSKDSIEFGVDGVDGTGYTRYIGLYGSATTNAAGASTIIQNAVDQKLSFDATMTRWSYNASIYIQMDATGISLAGYTADQQTGIYARFG